MNLVLFFSVYFIVLALLIYVLLCGNTSKHANTIVGKMYRHIRITFPEFAAKTCPFCCNSEKGCISRYLVVVFYIIIYLFLGLIFIAEVVADMPSFIENYAPHILTSFGLLPLPWLFFIIIQFKNPGIIDSTNVDAYLKRYPYDNVIYKPKECPTDHIPAVARSRFCRFTKHRIARYDHYCPWILRPIGERNHLVFLMFLLSNLAVTGYISIMTLLKMRWLCVDVGNIVSCAVWMCRSQLYLIGDWLVVSIVAIILVFMLGQHLYYISRNVLTIEMEKYEQERLRREMSGNHQAVTNFYDNGFLNNWKMFFLH